MKSIVMPPNEGDFSGDPKAYEKAKTEFYSELRECLSEVKTGQAVVSLKNMVRKVDGSYSNQQVLVQQQVVSDRADYTIFLNGTEVYLIIRSRDDVELQRIKNLWDILRHKNTASVASGKLPDAIFVVDLVRLRLEKNLTYAFSFINPLIITNENSETSNPELQLMFRVENVFLERKQSPKKNWNMKVCSLMSRKEKKK